jgi:hypothetical protein
MLGPKNCFQGHGVVCRQLEDNVRQHVDGPPAFLELRFGPEVCFDASREGAVLGDGRVLRGRDWHRLCLVPRAAEVEVAELVGNELQAFKTDGLVGAEAGNVPSPASAIDGELQVPKADGTPECPTATLMSRAAIERSHGGESARLPLLGAPTVGVSITG